MRDISCFTCKRAYTAVEGFTVGRGGGAPAKGGGALRAGEDLQGLLVHIVFWIDGASIQGRQQGLVDSIPLCLGVGVGRTQDA